MSRLGVLTGLAGEAGLFARTAADLPEPPIVACAGADAARAGREARRLVAEGAGALLSFGLCAGLDPALRPGALVCPETVLGPDGRAYAVDPPWRAQVLAALDSIGRAAAGGTLAGVERALARPADKRALAARAAAADMESHALAAAAAAAGVPLLVVRAVADPAGRALPPAALGALTADGRTRPLAVLREVARRPRQGPALARLAWEARAGYAALGDVARLGPALVRG